MLLTENERCVLLEFAAIACNEFAGCVSWDEDNLNGAWRYRILNQQASGLCDLFSQSPCEVSRAQVRRCLRLAGMTPLCAWGDKQDYDKIAEFFHDFKGHLRVRFQEDATARPIAT